MLLIPFQEKNKEKETKKANKKDDDKKKKMSQIESQVRLSIIHEDSGTHFIESSALIHFGFNDTM